MNHKFSLGKCVITPGAIELLKQSGVNYGALLQRHVSGDWGDMSPEDKAENDFSVSRELRIFSAYALLCGKIWVITEADRSVTTLLLPSEY